MKYLLILLMLSGCAKQYSAEQCNEIRNNPDKYLTSPQAYLHVNTRCKGYGFVPKSKRSYINYRGSDGKRRSITIYH